jgi:hypothetical protein
MVYCPGCGTANRDGSRFCNECGTKLPTMTSSLCPTCGTPNPPHSLFCEKCGTRLIASLAEEPEEMDTPAPAAYVPKGLSLPTKATTEVESAAAPGPVEPQPLAEPAKPAEEELPDWMQVVQSAVANTSELDIAKAAAVNDSAAEPAPEEVPAWLSDLNLGGPVEPPEKPASDELLPEWTQRLRTLPESAQPSAEEEEVPDWLKTLGTTGQLPSMFETPAAAPETTPPPAAFAAPLVPPAEEGELPEWLKEPATPYFSAGPEASPPTALPAADDMPDWLRDLHPAASSEDALPDWLDELGQEERPTSESMALSTGDSALDWLSQLSATAPETSLEPEAAPAPDWMSTLRAAEPNLDTRPVDDAPGWVHPLDAPQPSLESPAASETPDWLSSLRAAPLEPETPAEEEGAPDWLKGAGVVAAGAVAFDSAAEEEQSAEVAPQKPATDWLAALRQATPEMEAETQAADEVPAWLRDESGGAPQAIGGVPAFDQEASDWLHATQTPVESAEPAAQSADEDVPEWLKGAGVVAIGAAAFGSFADEEPPELAPQKPATDWLAALRQATPEMEAEQPQAEVEIPAWSHDESGVAPQAIGGVPAYDQDVPDWLRAIQTPGESTEPAAQPADEGVPDWLKGAGIVAAGAAALSSFAEEESPQPISQKPATDWLATLRQATPEMESGQVAEEAEPDWLREESGAAPQAIGGVHAYDQDVPDWLREESGVAFTPAQPVAAESQDDGGVPDWLQGLGAVTVGAAAVAASRAEEPADEGVPDWLRDETTPPVQSAAVGEVPDWLREAEPAPAIAFETPEETEAGETPDWLRNLAPVADMAAVAVEASEEIEQPEETAEPEPEEESWVSKAAPVAAAGLAAAAVVGAAKKPEQAESAPAEMPEWLKEIRQEQQVTQAAIPVPPPEAAGLTQTEIPAWLEAMRPTEEAGEPREAETPLETEGPLAGILNALPPAPIMGEISGLPAKLQFTISAEDQARAGVLKELLTQHAVAPASVEQFIVKGSVVRRRALRWVVAFLIIAALFIPMGIDINRSTGLPLMPTATNMFMPPANMSAAVQIAKIAQLPNSKVLVVFDYDATQSGEMNRVAIALLKSPALGRAQLQIASLNPQGSAMAQTVLKNFPDLRHTDLGFAPGQINGVQAVLAKAGNVNLIIDLAASPETVRWWAEQLKANRDQTPLVAGISAGAEPLTMPYVQSGQVKGLVSGFPGAVAYLNAAQQMNTYDQKQIKDYQIPLDALTLANYVMVGLIIFGLIAALLRGARRRSA